MKNRKYDLAAFMMAVLVGAAVFLDAVSLQERYPKKSRLPYIFGKIL